MLSQAQRTAILEMNSQRVSIREMARLLQLVTSGHTSSSAFELHACAGDSPSGEGRTVPATDPRSFEHLQGQSRASP